MIALRLGQKVWATKPVFAYGQTRELLETEVSKIGRKYFYLKDFPDTKFCLETGRKVSNYSGGQRVIVDKQVYDDENEHSDLSGKLRKAVTQDYLKLPYTLDQLRKVAEILNI